MLETGSGEVTIRHPQLLRDVGDAFSGADRLFDRDRFVASFDGYLAVRRTEHIVLRGRIPVVASEFTARVGHVLFASQQRSAATDGRVAPLGCWIVSVCGLRCGVVCQGVLVC